MTRRDHLSAAQIEEERQAFEAWFPYDRYLLTRVRRDRDYDFDATQLAWDAWLEATGRAEPSARMKENPL